MQSGLVRRRRPEREQAHGNMEQAQRNTYNDYNFTLLRTYH